MHVPLCLPLAIALLNTPVDAGIEPGFNYLRPVIQAAAIHLEILDPREGRYVCARPDDFAADARLLRRRWHDLHDAPRLHDAMMFPERALVNDLLAFNRQYRQHLDGRREVELADWWNLREAIQQTDRLYQFWDTVRDCRCEYYYCTVRRQALKKLRDDLLGHANYYSGRLPAHVPIHRFARLD